MIRSTKQLCLILVFGVLFFSTDLMAAWGPPSEDKMPRVSSLKGQVQINGSPAQKSQILSTGDKITTAAKGRVKIKFGDESKLQVKPNTQIGIVDVLLKADRLTNQVSLISGAISVKVKAIENTKSGFQIHTPPANFGAWGTQFTVSYDPKTDEAIIRVKRGSVMMNPNNINSFRLMLWEGQGFSITEAGGKYLKP